MKRKNMKDRAISVANRSGLLAVALILGLTASACGDGSDEALAQKDLSEQNEPSPTIFAPYTEDEKTVASVDLERYLGKWYEVATDVIFFQEDCTGSTATYSLNPDNSIEVNNECYLNSLDGEYYQTLARAEILNTDTNAELLVYFTPDFGADYWIIELDGQEGDEPYEWAVVGSFFDIFLWVLSRTPTMEPERMEMILKRLDERGYDLDNLSFTTQPVE